MNVLSMFDLKGEKAIVTGGGQGLGREMALALAEAGADVAVVQRRVEVAEQTAEEIRELGRDASRICPRPVWCHDYNRGQHPLSKEVE